MSPASVKRVRVSIRSRSICATPKAARRRTASSACSPHCRKRWSGCTLARADSGFYCREAVEAYEKHGCWFVLSAQKTPRLVEELQAARWTGSPRTDADGQCEFRYQPEGWGRAYRFVALRYVKKPKPNKLNEPEQYQLFDTPQYSYRVFVTNLDAPIDVVVGSYRQRAGGGESDQRSQQRCGLGGASIAAMGHELCALPVGDVGLQPELLADAVPAGGTS